MAKNIVRQRGHVENEAIKPADLGADGNITYSIGILGTPVVDPLTNTIYFVSRTEAGVGTAGATFAQKLNTLDITTGAPKFGSPVTCGQLYDRGWNHYV